MKKKNGISVTRDMTAVKITVFEIMLLISGIFFRASIR